MNANAINPCNMTHFNSSPSETISSSTAAAVGCFLVSSSSSPRPLRQRKRKITIQLLQKLYELPLHDAAKMLSVCDSAIKKFCRKNGITKWPYRRVRSIESTIRNLRAEFSSRTLEPSDVASIQKRIHLLQEQKVELLNQHDSWKLKKRSGKAHEHVHRATASYSHTRSVPSPPPSASTMTASTSANESYAPCDLSPVTPPLRMPPSQHHHDPMPLSRFESARPLQMFQDSYHEQPDITPTGYQGYQYLFHSSHREWSTRDSIPASRMPFYRTHYGAPTHPMEHVSVPDVYQFQERAAVGNENNQLPSLRALCSFRRNECHALRSSHWE